MAEALVRTIKRDYVPQTVMHQQSAWINHYNEGHPPQGNGYRHP